MRRSVLNTDRYIEVGRSWGLEVLSRSSIKTAAIFVTVVVNISSPTAIAASVDRGATPFTAAQVADDDGYPQHTRTRSLLSLARSQAALNREFPASQFGRFTDYFPSPDFGAHVALLPTGKVLLFSFERIQSNPTVEPAPTNTIGAANAGRAYVWDPARGSGPRAFKAVPPPIVDMPDGTGQPRPAPFFCSAHSYLPNGMVGLFGGNLGGNDGSGAKLALVFDPWQERWYRQQDLAVGRWYPSVVTGADGRQIIVSGHSENGFGTLTDIVERFPAPSNPLPVERTDRPENWPVERLAVTAPFSTDYPHLFSLSDGNVYAFGRTPTDQWFFDPATGTRGVLPPRPDGVVRRYGSAVPLPGGPGGPDSVLVLGGDKDNPNTYEFSHGQWSTRQPRAFGRTQDDTLLMPDGTLLTVNGSFGVRDYGFGFLNPKSDLKYRQVEIRDTAGNWRLGPAQRLPRGYHSNAMLLPDGRVMVTGDELQQLANDANISDDMNGTIEIYEPWYLHQGSRPRLDSIATTTLDHGTSFHVTTSTPRQVSRAVLLAPTTATHAINTSQRHVELRIDRRDGRDLTLTAPPDAQGAPPGYYMLFLLDSRGVPSTARWLKLNPTPTDPLPDTATACPGCGSEGCMSC
jgi:hypothetical protein